jgi:hypothetical protein
MRNRKVKNMESILYDKWISSALRHHSSLDIDIIDDDFTSTRPHIFDRSI